MPPTDASTESLDCSPTDSRVEQSLRRADMSRCYGIDADEYNLLSGAIGNIFPRENL
jgi:hypothetical protein